MYNFIEDYPGAKSQILALAKAETDKRSWCDEVDDELIYKQISSPEFSLYMEMIFSETSEDASNISSYIQEPADFQF